MSRSNPTEHIQNPSQRWLDWSGSEGGLSYYDKEAKKTVPVALPFGFLLLDQLSTISGYSKKHEAGIFANEVRDTKAEVLVVKVHKGPTLAEGFYQAIKDRVVASGGKFCISAYIGFKNGAEMLLGNLKLKGASLSPWIDFVSKHRADLYKKAIVIKGSTRKVVNEGKKSEIIFFEPVFGLVDLTPESDAAATELDRTLQTYLKAYLAKSKTAQVEQPQHEPNPDDEPPPRDPDYEPEAPDLAPGDIPF